MVFRCDVYLGPPEDGHSACTLSIKLDNNGDLLLKAASKNEIRVKWRKTPLNHNYRTWRFLPKDPVEVDIAENLEFKSSRPEHRNPVAYKIFWSNYITAMNQTTPQSLNWGLLNVKSIVDTGMLSGEGTSREKPTPSKQSNVLNEPTWKPFECLGYGKLGQAVLVKRVSDGAVRVCKNFAQKADPKIRRRS